MQVGTRITDSQDVKGNVSEWRHDVDIERDLLWLCHDDSLLVLESTKMSDSG